MAIYSSIIKTVDNIYIKNIKIWYLYKLWEFLVLHNYEKAKQITDTIL